MSEQITCLPIIHGSGDYAIEVRRLMLTQHFDCLAVPLPPSFQDEVERAIEFLPGITLVLQPEPKTFRQRDWTPDSDFESAEGFDDEQSASYVPIDPCQGVIMAIRVAVQERMKRAFIDLETASFEPYGSVLPDPYALKKVSSERFAAAVLPSVPRPLSEQSHERNVMMASRLRELEKENRSILFVCSLMDWPWIRQAYNNLPETLPEDDEVEETNIYAVDPDTLTFMLGELPFITWLYERARSELEDDENLSIDGIKELLLATRDYYQADLRHRARPIPPKLLTVYFKYVRNLSLIERRLTPDLYTLIIAAQQIAGDEFAVHLTETARQYPETGLMPFPMFRMGVDTGRILPEGDLLNMKNRLPGHPVSWRTCELKPLPPKKTQQEWKMRWNPFRQCSYPPEDVAIERFRTHVKDVALAIMGNDLSQSEKFTTSFKDGLDIRETLRNWHTGDLYVKVIPPNTGTLDCVVMLFDSPADPRDYPWRITWHAEHNDESTLALFATDFHQEMVGPGIGQAVYGGAMFLFPPRPVPDIWSDPRLDYTDTLEERLLASAFLHSEHPHVALLSSAPPGAGWRRLAKKYQKKIVHVPLSRFSQQTIQQLRIFHVLNGQQVRSYAAHYIRNA